MGAKNQLAVGLEHEQQCWQLRCRGMTFDQIAKEVGFKNRGNAYRAYKRAYNRRSQHPAEMVDEYREQQLEILDIIVRANIAKVDVGDRDATEMVLKAIKQRADLLGLNAPMKAAHTRHDGRPSEYLHVITASLERKLARLAASFSPSGLLTGVPHRRKRWPFSTTGGEPEARLT